MLEEVVHSQCLIGGTRLREASEGRCPLQKPGNGDRHALEEPSAGDPAPCRTPGNRKKKSLPPSGPSSLPYWHNTKPNVPGEIFPQPTSIIIEPAKNLRSSKYLDLRTKMLMTCTCVFCKYFSQAVACLFIFLSVSFEKPVFLI